jgi:hypothetical protein
VGRRSTGLHAYSWAAKMPAVGLIDACSCPLQPCVLSTSPLGEVGEGACYVTHLGAEGHATAGLERRALGARARVTRALLLERLAPATTHLALGERGSIPLRQITPGPTPRSPSDAACSAHHHLQPPRCSVVLLSPTRVQPGASLRIDHRCSASRLGHEPRLQPVTATEPPSSGHASVL